MPDLHPALVLLFGALLVGVLPRRWGGAVMVGTAVTALLAVLSLDEATRWSMGFYGYELTVLRLDGLARPFAIAFALVTAIAGTYGWSTMGRVERIAALATAGAGMGVVVAGDLLTLFVFWELKVITVAFVVLAGSTTQAAAATSRYLGVHLASGAVLLAGILWNLADTGSLAMDRLTIGPPTVLLLLGVLVSAAAIPFNAWLPDAYPQATAAGTVVLSAFTTKSAVYLLARAFPGLDVLVWVGVTMAIVGVVYAIVEDDIRKLLSYHIVSQVGFMVAAIGVGTDAAINGATAHATAHIMYKGLLLMGAGAVLYATGRTRSSSLGGLARAHPWVVVLYLVGAASISGVPLFSGFPAKELALGAIGDGGQPAAQWLLKFASVGTFLSVALKLPAVTWFGEARGSLTARRIPATMYAAMAVAATVNIAIGVSPGLLFDQMPTAVAFEAYTAAKVVETSAMLAFTIIGFVLLRRWLVPTPAVMVDTDWVYRELPAHVAPAVAGLARRGRIDVEPRDRWRAIGARSLQWRNALVGSGDGPVVPGWLLGSAVVAAMVLVLAVSVLP